MNIDKHTIIRSINSCADRIKGVLAESESGDWPETPPKPPTEFIRGDGKGIFSIEPGFGGDKKVTLIQADSGPLWYTGPFTEALLSDVRIIRHLYDRAVESDNYDQLVRDVYSYYGRLPAPYMHPHSGKISNLDGNLFFNLVYA